MWISEKELNDRIQSAKAQSKLDGYMEGIKNTVFFSAYYAERLEWWKTQFDKKPELHRVDLWSDEGQADFVEFHSLSSAHNFISMVLRLKDDYIKVIDPVKFIQRASIKRMTIQEGHPAPYGDNEIAAWAKEQLEKEMQGWKVIKENRTEKW